MFKAEFDRSEIPRAKAKFQRATSEIKVELEQAIIASVNDIITKNVLPDGSGWIEWYLRSMSWVKEGDEWDLQVEEEIKFKDIPSDRSLLRISGTGPVPFYFHENNPWPIKSIPKVRDGYKMSAFVIPVSADELSFHEARVEKLKTKTTKTLKDHGLSTSASDLEFKGGLKVDVDFLIKRIEHGLGGFTRQPHMLKVKQAIESKIRGISR